MYNNYTIKKTVGFLCFVICLDFFINLYFILFPKLHVIHMYVLLNLRVKAVKEYSSSHTHISFLVKKQTKKKKEKTWRLSWNWLKNQGLATIISK